MLPLVDELWRYRNGRYYYYVLFYYHQYGTQHFQTSKSSNATYALILRVSTSENPLMSLCTATKCPHIINYSNVCMYQCSALPCVNTEHISTPESPGSVVSRFGPAVKRSAGIQKGYGSIPLRLSLLFKKVVVCGHCLVTLSLTINETSYGSRRCQS